MVSFTAEAGPGRWPARALSCGKGGSGWHNSCGPGGWLGRALRAHLAPRRPKACVLGVCHNVGDPTIIFRAQLLSLGLTKVIFRDRLNL